MPSYLVIVATTSKQPSSIHAVFPSLSSPHSCWKDFLKIQMWSLHFSANLWLFCVVYNGSLSPPLISPTIPHISCCSSNMPFSFIPASLYVLSSLLRTLPTLLLFALWVSTLPSRPSSSPIKLSLAPTGRGRCFFPLDTHVAFTLHSFYWFPKVLQGLGLSPPPPPLLIFVNSQQSVHLLFQRNCLKRIGGGWTWLVESYHRKIFCSNCFFFYLRLGLFLEYCMWEQPSSVRELNRSRTNLWRTQVSVPRAMLFCPQCLLNSVWCIVITQ